MTFIALYKAIKCIRQFTCNTKSELIQIFEKKSSILFPWLFHDFTITFPWLFLRKNIFFHTLSVVFFPSESIKKPQKPWCCIQRHFVHLLYVPGSVLVNRRIFTSRHFVTKTKYILIIPQKSSMLFPWLFVKLKSSLLFPWLLTIFPGFPDFPGVPVPYDPWN